MSTVRTRFAPSPTGALHVGGVRTALFNYLLARHCGGQFILRIEDTDRTRSTQESVEEILAAMRWLELEWDEGPFFQTERLPLYQAAVEKLLARGLAYPCTCSPEELEARREAAQAAGRAPTYDRHCRPGFGPGPTPGAPAAIRLASPTSGETVVEDLVKGRVVFQNADIEDLIVARSDGTPTYNLCVTVDDLEMRITHVIRGDDHLTNTPKQVLIYQGLEGELPAFAHLPQVLGMDGARLSKRHAATAVVSYREQGYYADALLNFLARLGWSHGDQEIFRRDELVAAFSLEHVGKSAGVFNLEKLEWLNFQYLKERTPEQLAHDIRPFLAARQLPCPGDDAWLGRMAATLRERAKTLVELVDLARYFLVDEIEFDEKAAKKFLTPATAESLRRLAVALAGIPVQEWTNATVETAFRGVLTETGLGMGALAQPVRVATTGGTVSPGIFEVLDVLGRERTLGRLEAAIARAVG